MSKYHFIGIKGSGMSSLAQIAYDMGNEVQGSDEEHTFLHKKNQNKETSQCLAMGQKISKKDSDVILGNAFDETHAEYRRAKELGLKTYTYSPIFRKITF